MSLWGGGYVTDSLYADGYFPQQSPHHIALASLLAGVLPPDTGPGLSYMELGCGSGFGALVLAASNPGWTVTGIEFAPGQIARAREIAAAAGITNATFVEADLATLAGSAAAASLPEADIVTMHGVWSWVAAPVRAGIVRLLASKLRPGGLAQVSFNALPAWGPVLGLRQTLLEVGRQGGGRSDRQVATGAAFIEALAATGARHLAGDGQVETALGFLRRATPTQIAHEFFNEGWQPCFFSEVAEAMAGAKLDFVTSCHLMETVPALSLSGDQQRLIERIEHPRARETAKDLCLKRALRQDLFVRGALRLRPEERAARLRAVRLALSRAADRFDREIATPVGIAALDEAVYGPVVAALAEGPRSVGALLGVAGRDAPDPAELLVMLVGSHQAFPVACEDGAARGGDGALNALASGRLVRADRLDAPFGLASARLGNGVPCTGLEMFVHGRMVTSEAPSPDAWAASFGRGREASEVARLASALADAVAACAPAWRTLGLLG